MTNVQVGSSCNYPVSRRASALTSQWSMDWTLIEPNHMQDLVFFCYAAYGGAQTAAEAQKFAWSDNGESVSEGDVLACYDAASRDWGQVGSFLECLARYSISVVLSSTSGWHIYDHVMDTITLHDRMCLQS